MLTALLGNEEGQSLAEYALILVLISIAALAALTAMGTDIITVLTTISAALQGS
jgi:Flp pilus assembly pilin Flp